MRKPTLWFLNRSDTNRAVQSQKQARILKFRIYEEEEVNYLYSENKGAVFSWFSHEAAQIICMSIFLIMVMSNFVKCILIFSLQIFGGGCTKSYKCLLYS